MKIRGVMKLIEADGWRIVKTTWQPPPEAAPKTLGSILEHAGLKR